MTTAERLLHSLNTPPPHTHKLIAYITADRLEARWWEGGSAYQRPGGVRGDTGASYQEMMRLRRCILMEVEG